MVYTMRGIAIGAMAGAAALVAAAPADARAVGASGNLVSRGGITVAWHGDPARGCAAAGLCGYSGSVEIRPDQGQYDFVLKGRRLAESYSFLDLYSTPPVIRVKRTDAAGEDGACVDQPLASDFGLTAANAGHGQVRFGLAVPDLSTARCAGPDLSSLVARLPRRTRSLSRLTKRGAFVDFSGQVPFTAGRFRGTVRSTLRLRFSRSAPDVSSHSVPRPPDRRPRVRIVQLHARYRVTRVEGSLSGSFAALTDPPCADLDACGVSGTVTWAVSSNRGIFAIDAFARARRTDHGVRGALAAIRRGRGIVYGDGDLARDFGTTTADVSRSGGTPCHDTAGASAPGLAVTDAASRRLTFELGGEDAFFASADLMRTGCPGPRDEDVLGVHRLAAGSLPIGVLADRSFGVRMRGSGRFASHGYSGTRSADFTLGLLRTSVRATYRRARGFP
jgi:hypothetical protein